MTILLKDIGQKMENEDNLHHLLWTGGWDSTFRLIQIIVLLGEEVQPYYIIDPNRKSVRHEMRAMQWLKKEIFERYPTARSTVKPTQYIELNSISKNNRIMQSYKKIYDSFPIGIQYEWLARFACQYEIDNLELAVEKGLGHMNELLKKILEFQESKEQSTYRVKLDLKGKDAYTLFEHFTFPIIDTYKSDMIRISKGSGFFDILEKTWFCHNPLSNGKPCGVCTPCTQVVKEDMSFRLPLHSRVRYHFRLVLSKEQLKQYCPKLYYILRGLKGMFKKPD